ncbi:MAG: hypothetical protein EA422_15375 [Gemmatimonadales bacterium]|nr:MAG: hypothetical protein EA422_15375 [Gemmatimonadales bacterium]
MAMQLLVPGPRDARSCGACPDRPLPTGMGFALRSDPVSIVPMNRPRVVFLTRDSLYSRDFLSTFLEAHPSEMELVGIILSSRAGGRGGSLVTDAWRWSRTVGVRYSAYMAWVALVAPLLLRAAPSPATLARSAGIPLLRAADVNAPGTHLWLRERSPDVMVSAHFNQWVAPETLDLARVVCLNIHPGPLPAYRGVDPVHFALRAGEDELGVTLHVMAEEIDGGDIVAQRRRSVLPGGRIPNNRRLYREGGEMAAGVLASLDTALLRRRPQPQEGRSYFGWDRIRPRG